MPDIIITTAIPSFNDIFSAKIAAAISTPKKGFKKWSHVQTIYFHTKDNSWNLYNHELDLIFSRGGGSGCAGCAPNIWPNDDFYKLSLEKEILKIGQDLTDLQVNLWISLKKFQ